MNKEKINKAVTETRNLTEEMILKIFDIISDEKEKQAAKAIAHIWGQEITEQLKIINESAYKLEKKKVEEKKAI